MWEFTTGVVLGLYVLFALFIFLVSSFAQPGPGEPVPTIVWMRAVGVVLVMALGLLCIYLSVRLFRRHESFGGRVSAKGRTHLLRSLAAALILVLGWLCVFFAVPLRPGHVVQLLNGQAGYGELLAWGFVAILFLWMVTGYRGRALSQRVS